MNRSYANRVSRRNLIRYAGASTCLLMASSMLIGPGTIRAQTPVASEPVTLEGVIKAGIERGLTGIALRVERGEETLFDGVGGLASTELKTPVALGDRFGIGSITKTYVATIVLQTVDEGKLTLEDTVTHWLSDPTVKAIPYVDDVTIRQLLTHTSGIYDYFDGDSVFWQDAYFGPNADWSRVWTPLELLAYAAGDVHAPYFAPGEGITYSNTGYVLLGLILEQATGRRFADLLQERILDPLALKSTIYAATEPVSGGMVDAYHLIESDLVNVSTISLSALSTAGGMVSDTQDTARFARALLEGDLVSPASLTAMTTFVPSGRPHLDAGMGMFQMETPQGAMIVGNSGDSPGFSARMYRHAESDLTMVLLTNTGGEDELVNEVYLQAVAIAMDAGA